MLSYKRKFFKNFDDYDKYSIVTATRIFNRLKNRDQFILLENGNYKLERVKSILNYIKQVLYPLKVKYQQEFYAQEIPFNNKDEFIQYGEAYIKDSYNYNKNALCQIDIQLYLSKIYKVIHSFIYKIPNKLNSSEQLNIYISCLLSFLNLITINNKCALKLNNIKYSKSYEKQLNNIYKKNITIVLYHLDDTYTEYVEVLLNKLKKIIVLDILQLSNQYSVNLDAIQTTIQQEIFDE